MMKKELRRILEAHKGAWKRIEFGEANAYLTGFRFKNRELVILIQEVITRYAAKMSARGGIVFETPLVEVRDDIPIA